MEVSSIISRQSTHCLGSEVTSSNLSGVRQAIHESRRAWQHECTRHLQKEEKDKAANGDSWEPNYLFSILFRTFSITELLDRRKC